MLLSSPLGCFEKHISCSGKLQPVPGVDCPVGCMGVCRRTPGCQFWTWTPHMYGPRGTPGCFMQKNDKKHCTHDPDGDVVSGPPACEGMRCAQI